MFNSALPRNRAWQFLFTGFLTAVLLAWPQAPQAAKSETTADHGKFEELEGPFATGPDVTKACLSCHTEAAKQIHKTTHWTWAFEHPVTGQDLGKRNVVNNFCVATATNWPRCTSCHVGYGWKDETFDLAAEDKVDCLVCHDQTGKYRKFPTGSGHPAYKPKEFPPGSGKIWQPPDLAMIAQNVGQPTRENCGICHFYGGGGDGVKHGDLDSSMANPGHALDVHMDKDGLNFTCTTCHTTGSHEVTGSRYVTKAKDTNGIDIPGHTDDTRATCESCHGMAPHEEKAKLNDHTDKIACTTCHVPEYARGGVKTKLWWDWSTAGKKNEQGKPFQVKDADGFPTYDTKKGDFVWEANVQPEYYWFDGKIEYTLLNDTIDDKAVVPINRFGGSYDDPDSRIWPFKVMRGRQPYDKGNMILAVPHLFGKDENAFWKSFDWGKALQAGLMARNVSFSGEYDFVETEYFWPITHMVAPKEESVTCNECHAKDSRLGKLNGFYLPGRDNFPWLNTLGWSLAALTLLGVVLHGLLRMVFGRRKN